jgi:hypothetical protein
VISGIRRKTDENCALRRYYAASNGNFLPTFRDNLSVLFSEGSRIVVLTDVSGEPGGPIFTGQESVVISYRRFGTTYRSHFRGSRIWFLPTLRDNLSVPFSGVKNLVLTDASGQPVGPIFEDQESGSYRRFGTTYRSHFRGPRIRGYFLPTFWDNLSVPFSGSKNPRLFLADVSVQPIGPIFTPEDRNDMVAPKRR